MIVSVSVSTSKYKLVQDQSTKVCTFYVLGVQNKTIEQSAVLTIDELYNLLMDEATAYQNSQEDDENE